MLHVQLSLCASTRGTRLVPEAVIAVKQQAVEVPPSCLRVQALTLSALAAVAVVEHYNIKTTTSEVRSVHCKAHVLPFSLTVSQRDLIDR